VEAQPGRCPPHHTGRSHASRGRRNERALISSDLWSTREPRLDCVSAGDAAAPCGGDSYGRGQCEKRSYHTDLSQSLIAPSSPSGRYHLDRVPPNLVRLIAWSILADRLQNGQGLLKHQAQPHHRPEVAVPLRELVEILKLHSVETPPQSARMRGMAHRAPATPLRIKPIWPAQAHQGRSLHCWRAPARHNLRRASGVSRCWYFPPENLPQSSARPRLTNSAARSRPSGR